MEDENSKGGLGGLQRSAISFRRQGSSGLVWEDRFLSGELNQVKKKEEEEKGVQDQEHHNKKRHHHHHQRQQQEGGGGELKVAVMERSRSAGGGGRGYRTGKVSPALDPPSPKLSACGFCAVFGKSAHGGARRSKTGKRKT